MPTSRNLWFQLEVGIQTSNPMTESGTDEMVPVTRQKGGSSLSGGPGFGCREKRIALLDAREGDGCVGELESA
ncbi:hypothetical protein [Tunturiibacter gelidiferens]|uniref:hypothetical protein n=1 Tax=Tunturiibacter gelidiferens TaxID=3069689 RepID=UPI003D9BDBE6